MRVSFVELFMHCKKVFRACGVPYGCADDGAEVVTWSEFVGLEGMKVLQEEISEMRAAGMESVHLCKEENGLFRFDGNGQSAIVLGKLMSDYALAMAELRQTVRIHMQNTSRSRLLAQPASYVASRGKGCLVNYKTAHGVNMWILATPEIAFPVFAEGDIVEQIMQDRLTNELGKYETTNLGTNDFWLVCTTETDLITSCVRKLRQEARKGTVRMTESSQLKANWEKAFYSGAKVDQYLWDQLGKVGKKTLVEATELSRLRGAGEMAQ